MSRLKQEAILRAKRPFERGLRRFADRIRIDDEPVAQKMLAQSYGALARTPGAAPPTFAEVGFRKYSQFEEDGILLYLFSVIPPINRTCVEICAGDGRECNTANLILNHGWWGHLFDGSEDHVRSGRAFYARHPDTFAHPPSFTHAWVTAENVNQLVAGSGASGPVDLLSLDIDGMDYWVWKALTVVEPQVVVCEVHNPVPPDLALTVPYDPDFVCESENYRGASLAAMVKLGRDKGYRLVGTHRLGFNAFFVRDGLAEDLLPEVSAESCAADPFTQAARRARWPDAQRYEWEDV